MSVNGGDANNNAFSNLIVDNFSESSDDSNDIIIIGRMREYIPEEYRLQSQWRESNIPSSMSSDDSDSNVKSSENCGSLKIGSSEYFGLSLPNYIKEINILFTGARDELLKEMLNSPTKRLSEQSLIKNKKFRPYSNSIPPELKNIRKQLLKEVKQSGWNSSVAGVTSDTNDNSEEDAHIKPVLESTCPLRIPSFVTQNEVCLIKIERKALEHRSMLLYLTYLISKEFENFDQINCVEKLEDYYSCFRLMVKENVVSKNELDGLIIGKNHGNRFQRVDRLIKNNDKNIRVIWYGLFLARVQVGLKEGNIKKVSDEIRRIYDGIENMER